MAGFYVPKYQDSNSDSSSGGSSGGSSKLFVPAYSKYSYKTKQREEEDQLNAIKEPTKIDAAKLPDTFKLKSVDGKTEVEFKKDDFLKQWDAIGEQKKKLLFQQIQAEKGRGSEGAMIADKVLDQAGKYKGGLFDFAEGAEDKFFGGFRRSAARAFDFVTPGDQSEGVKKFLKDTQSTDEENIQYKGTGRLGQKVGSAGKGIAEAATMVVGSGAVTGGLKGTKAVQGLAQGGKVAQAASKAVPYVAGSATGSAIGAGIDIGAGNESQYKKNILLGTAADLVLPGVGKLAKAGKGAVAKGIGKGISESATGRPFADFEAGKFFDGNGKEVTIGRYQQLTQDPSLTRIENDINAGGGPGSLKLDRSPEELNRVLDQSIKENAEKYSVGKVRGAGKRFAAQVDPAYELAKIDTAYAKKQGINLNDLPADQRLEHKFDMALNSDREVDAIAKAKLPSGQSLTDVIKKYGEGTTTGKEFNNYLNARFDLEVRGKYKGKRKLIQAEDQELDALVKNYEARNPQALVDAQALKEYNDEMIRIGDRAGLFKPGEADEIINSYKTAVPLERVFPDDLARANIATRSTGSISKQSITDRIVGNTDIPLSNSFDRFVNRAKVAVGNKNRAELAKAYLERVQQGVAKGDLTVEAGLKTARKGVREDIQLLNKGIRRVEKKIQVDNRQIRRLQSEINRFEKEGLDIKLKGATQDPLPNLDPALISQLKTLDGKSNNTRAFVKTLMEAEPSQLKLLKDKVATREPKLAALFDKVEGERAIIDSNKALKTELKDITAQLMDDPTTGKQIVSGVIDGEPYKLEVPPEIAKVLQGLNSAQMDGVLKGLGVVNKAYRLTWTGFLAPVFAMKSVLYDLPMSVINSPQGFKTIGPSAVKEAMASIVGKSDFQDALKGFGAQTIGASKLGNFVAPSAEAIAAQRDIASRIKFNAKNPAQFIDSLDVLGGKLAEATRVRTAKAAYKDGIKKGLSNDEAMSNAAYAFNNILPNYRRTTHLIKGIDTIFPFTAASIAGTRSMAKAIKRNPKSFALKAAALGPAPMIGVAAYSMNSDAGQAYYEDMRASGKEYVLDNNFTVVMPWAKRDDKTGEWSGIYKIPVAPEFRPMNRTAWRSVQGATGGEGVKGTDIAGSIFDSLTGGLRDVDNPQKALVQILAGQDPMSGEDLVKGQMRDLPKEEQVFDSTSGAGRLLGRLSGNRISPIQGDKILGQFGATGRAIKSGNPVGEVGKDIRNTFVGGLSQTGNNAFYDAYQPAYQARTKANKKVSDLIEEGKPSEARMVAEEFNQSLNKRFERFMKTYADSDSYSPEWDDKLNELFIKTTPASFKSRQYAIKKRLEEEARYGQ